MLQYLKFVWGYDKNRTFQVAAWGLSLAAFGGYTLYKNSYAPIDVEAWNKKIKEKTANQAETK